MKLSSVVAFHHFRLASTLRVKPRKFEKRVTEQLRKMRSLKPKFQATSMSSATIAAGYWAAKEKRTYFVFGGIYKGLAVWRVTWRWKDVIDSDKNKGNRIVIVEPDLGTFTQQVARPNYFAKTAAVVDNLIGRNRNRKLLYRHVDDKTKKNLVDD